MSWETSLFGAEGFMISGYDSIWVIVLSEDEFTSINFDSSSGRNDAPKANAALENLKMTGIEFVLFP